MSGLQLEEVTYLVDDPVAVLTLNRPHALNAWTPTMGDEIDLVLRTATDDPRVVGIVVTGAGRGFCAGADWRALQQEVPGTFVPTAGDPAWGDDFRGRFTSFLSVPKPMIAAINGPAVGMAVAMILACDLRFMAPGATIAASFARLGLVAELGTSWLLPRTVGVGAAMDLLLSGRPVEADEALRLGLVDRVVDDGPVVDAARRYVADLAEHCSPAAMAAIKRQVNQQLHRGLGEAEAASRRLMAASHDWPDFAEGTRAFAERRRATFGRLGTGNPPPAGR